MLEVSSRTGFPGVSLLHLSPTKAWTTLQQEEQRTENVLEAGVVCTPVMPALSRKRQEDREFKDVLRYIASLRLAWAV